MKNFYKGYFYITLSAIFFGTYGIWSKLMENEFGNFTQAWIRTVIITIITFIYLISAKNFQKINNEDIKWFILIGISGGLTFAPYFYAFQHLNIGTATFLFYSTLTFGSYVFGKLIFKEELSLVKLISFLIGIIGVLVIFKFNLSKDHIFPAITAAFAGLMGSIEVVFTKKLSNKYSNFQTIFITFLIMTLLNFSLGSMNNEVIPDLRLSKAWLAELLYTFSMLLAFYFVIEGYKYIEPSIAGLIGLSEIVFGVVFGIIFFKEKLNISFIIGGLIILISITIPLLKEIRIDK